MWVQTVGGRPRSAPGLGCPTVGVGDPFVAPRSVAQSRHAARQVVLDRRHGREYLWSRFGGQLDHHHLRDQPRRFQRWGFAFQDQVVWGALLKRFESQWGSLSPNFGLSLC